MKRKTRLCAFFSAIAALALLGGCATHPNATSMPVNVMSAPVQPSAAHDTEGALVIAHLNERYTDTATTCGSASRPIFLCSGVMFRATVYSPAYHSWVPNPNSPKGDGVSFSFLRNDAKFNKLAYSMSHGFIAYPQFYKPGPAVDLEVLCGFPIDADTDNRVADGCGYDRAYPTNSGPCQAQGITTSAQWIAHYRTAGVANPRQHQCGFQLVSGTANSAAIFMQNIAAMNALGNESFQTQNELIVGSWKYTPDQVGIEGFFYLGGSAGLADSQNEQRDFYATVNVWRPLIRMTLPAASTGRVTFTYTAAEQGVP